MSAIKIKCRMKRPLLRIVAATSCLVGAAAGQAQLRVCPSGKKSPQMAVEQVVILRPRVKIKENDSDLLTGASEQIEEGLSEQVAAQLHAALGRAFEDKGYGLWPDPILMPEWEQTRPNDGIVNRLQGDFDALFPAGSSPDCKTLLKTSFKDDLEGLTGSDKFDVLVLARAKGYRLKKGSGIASKAKYAVELAYGGWVPASDLYMSIAVVDRSTGAMRYYCESSASRAYVEAPDRWLSVAIHKCLKQFSDAANKSSH